MHSTDKTRLIGFESSIGWIGIEWQDQGEIITRVQMGFATRDALSKQFARPIAREESKDGNIIVQFRQFVAGRKTALLKWRIDESCMSPFQRRVVDACRQIPWGETLTYGKLAEVAGSPGASRAVGSVMSKNRFPLVVPCHRVVASHGLGGFTAPNGLSLKKRLLQNEAAAVLHLK